MKSQRTRARRESVVPTIDADKRRMRDEFTADQKSWYDIEERLTEWELFFRSAMTPADRQSDKWRAVAAKFVSCARDGLRAAVNARACIAENNDRGAEIYLLDMAFKTGELFYLDADRAFAAREKWAKNQPGGSKAMSAKGADNHERIRRDFNGIMSRPNPPSKGSARLTLLRRYEDEARKGLRDAAPSKSTIVNATKAKRSR